MGKKRKVDEEEPDVQPSRTKKRKQDSTGQFSITAMYIGQGDCILIKCPNNKLIMIDCGSVADASRKENEVADYLKSVAGNNSNTIDCLIITHSDRDHHNKVRILANAGVIVSRVILGNLSISDLYFLNNDLTTFPIYARTQKLKDAYEEIINDKHLLWAAWQDKYTKVNLSALDLLYTFCLTRQFTGLTINQNEKRQISLEFDDLTDSIDDSEDNLKDGIFHLMEQDNWSVQIIAAEVPNNHTDRAGFMNAASLVTVINIGGHKAVFTGDSIGATYNYLLRQSLPPIRSLLTNNIELLQIPHHGSESHESNQDAFIRHTNPRFLFTSVKFGENSYHLPRWGSLTKWKSGTDIAKDDTNSHYMGYWITKAEMKKKRVGSTRDSPFKIPKNSNVFDTPLDELDSLIRSFINPKKDECFLLTLKPGVKAEKLLGLKIAGDLMFVIQKTKKGITTNGSETLNAYFQDFINNHDVSTILTLKTRALKNTAFDNLDATCYLLTATGIEIYQAS